MTKKSKIENIYAVIVDSLSYVYRSPYKRKGVYMRRNDLLEYIESISKDFEPLSAREIEIVADNIQVLFSVVKIENIPNFVNILKPKELENFYSQQLTGEQNAN